MATRSSTKCPWRKFYKCVIKYMNILHMEACEPQMKITKFVYTMRHNFASPTMDLEQDKKSTQQLQGSKESIKQSKRVAQESNNSTKDRTSNSNTDSAYSTESESNYAAHLPRPPCSPKPTRQHLRPHPIPSPRPSKSQQLINTKCIQGTRPSCNPIPTKSNSKTSHLSTLIHQPKPSMSTPKTSYLSTSIHLQKPSTSMQPNIQATVKQPTLPATITTAFTYPQCTPLLPTPPASERISNNINNYKQHITRPSTFSSRKSTFTRPSESNNHRFHQQHIPRPSASPPRYNTYPTFSGPATNN